jgi:hypothetical protein
MVNYLKTFVLLRFLVPSLPYHDEDFDALLSESNVFQTLNARLVMDELP